MDKNNFKTVWLLLYTNIMLMMLCAHKHSHASLQILIIFHIILWACINILNKGVISVLLHLNYWWTYHITIIIFIILLSHKSMRITYSSVPFIFRSTLLHICIPENALITLMLHRYTKSKPSSPTGRISLNA